MLAQARNRVLHRAEQASQSEASHAIAVATAITCELFPAVVRQVGLHVHDDSLVCVASDCDSRLENPLQTLEVNAVPVSCDSSIDA